MAPAGRVIVADYAPRRAFMPFHDRAERFAVIVAHRRAGKTVATINDTIKRAVLLAKPEGRFAYIAPFYNQAKDVAWTYLKRYAAPVLAATPNESELRVDLLNGARIRLYGADNPDRLRGLYLDGVVLDEYADMAPALWGEIIRPMLADRQGWATFIGTPKGRNDFWRFYERGRSGEPNWLSIMLRADQTGLIDPDELAAARADMTEEEFAQEFLCSFEAAIRGAYFGKEVSEAERDGRICQLEADPSQPVHTAWDLGVGDSTAIWMFQVLHGGLHVVDFYEADGKGADHYVEVLNSKPYNFGVDFVPHDARVREWGSGGRTRIETLKGLGRNPRIIVNAPLDDGINAARLTLPRCRFDAERCAKGLESLRQYRREWDDQRKAFSDRPRHDWTSHAADAFRYLALAWREMRPEPVKAAPKPPAGVSSMTFDQMLKHASKPERSRI